MICPKCNRENEDGALFCRHCGSSMNLVPEKESNTSSVLILVWIIAVAILTIISDLHRIFFYDLLYTGIQIINNIIMILPAFTIKNKKIKIVGIIIITLLIMWRFFNLILGIIL